MSAVGLVRLILWRLAVAVPLLARHLLRCLRARPPRAGRPGARPARHAAVRPGDAGGAPRALSPRRPVRRAVRQVAVAGAAGRPRPLDQRQPARCSASINERAGVTICLWLDQHDRSCSSPGSCSASLAALRRGTRLDRAVVMFGVFGISSPAFVTGIFLLYVFGVVLGWFPTFGAGRGFLDRLWHLTLPALALALSVMAIVVKITRASMIEELDKDYVAFARARGLSRGAHHLRLRAAQRAHPGRHRRRAHRRRPARRRDLCRGDLRAAWPRLADRRRGAEARHPADPGHDAGLLRSSWYSSTW